MKKQVRGGRSRRCAVQETMRAHMCVLHTLDGASQSSGVLQLRRRLQRGRRVEARDGEAGGAGAQRSALLGGGAQRPEVRVEGGEDGRAVQQRGARDAREAEGALRRAADPAVAQHRLAENQRRGLCAAHAHELLG